MMTLTGKYFISKNGIGIKDNVMIEGLRREGTGTGIKGKWDGGRFTSVINQNSYSEGYLEFTDKHVNGLSDIVNNGEHNKTVFKGKYIIEGDLLTIEDIDNADAPLKNGVYKIYMIGDTMLPFSPDENPSYIKI